MTEVISQRRAIPAISVDEPVRRPDWRFLLPAPEGGKFQHLVVLGARPELAGSLRDLGFAQQVSRELPDDHSADGVVVLSTARVTLRQAAAALQPGGALYYEVDRRQPRHWGAVPSWMAHRSRAAGINPLGLYWAAPDFATCKRYLPLDMPEAMAWYLETLYLSGAPSHYLLELGARLLTAVNPTFFAALVPCYVLVGVAGDPGAGPRSLLSHPELPLSLRQPGVRSVVLTSGQDEASRIVLMPFAPGKRDPLAVVKVAARPDFNRNTEREQFLLTEMRARLDTTMQATVPEPQALLRHGELSIGLESYAPGRSLSISSGHWRASQARQIADLSVATDWLIRFHQQSQRNLLPWDEAAVVRWIEGPLATYAQTFGLTSKEAQLFERTRQVARELIGGSLPVVQLHHDFGPWNLYYDGEHFTVIDWEFGRNWEAERFGPGLYDLLYFVTYWSYVTRKCFTVADELRGFHELFIEAPPNDPWLRAARHAIGTYLDTLGMGPRWMPLILVYTWVMHAIHFYERKDALHIGHMGNRAHSRAVGYISVLAESTDVLFPAAMVPPTR